MSYPDVILVDGPAIGTWPLPELYRAKYDAGRLDQRTMTLRWVDPVDDTLIDLYDALGAGWRFRFRESVGR